MFDYTQHFMLALLVGLLCWAFAGSKIAHAWVMFPLGLLGSSYFVWRAGRSLVTYANYKLGFLGEQVVGQILDRLASPSIRVFHDMEIKEPGKKPWNIDHIVVASAGVWVIETKARRKPKGTQNGHKLIFDGQELVFPSPMRPDRYGLKQAQRNAEWLAAKLATTNGTPIPVSAALVFPGWWVEAKGKGSVSVLNAKQLPGFFSGRPSVLSDQQLKAISGQLDQYCRIDLSKPE